MDYEKVSAFNDWFDRKILNGLNPNYEPNSGVSNSYAPGTTIGDVVDGFHLNDDGSVTMTGLQNYDLNGLIDQLGNYFRASDPRIQYAWSAKEAQKERDWQTAMSNTAYQRSMADMKAAGLNPILAYSQGGATSGTGASASASPVNTGSSIGPIMQGVAGIINAVMSADNKSDALQHKAAMDMLRFKDSHSANEVNRQYKNSYVALNNARTSLYNRTKPAETKINIIKHK